MRIANYDKPLKLALSKALFKNQKMIAIKTLRNTFTEITGQSCTLKTAKLAIDKLIPTLVDSKPTEIISL